MRDTVKGMARIMASNNINNGIDQVLEAVKQFGPNTDSYKELGKIRVLRQDDLLLFNYTTEATFSANWSAIERICRGLIIHWPSATVAARPFDKFFNLGETPETALSALPAGPIEVTDKLDGSLGILYRQNNGNLAIATRGAFDGVQAQWATAFLQQNYRDRLATLPTDITLLFEIIYPDNRVVINYHGLTHLFVIGARRLDGQDFSYTELSELTSHFALPLVRQEQVDSIDNLIQAAEERTGIEGWVVRFQNGLRVKVKTEEYRRLHRLITHMSPNHIRAEMLSGSFDTFLAMLPSEYQNEVVAIAAMINAKIDAETLRIETIFPTLPKGSRKEFALTVMSNHASDAAYLFALLDGKDIRLMILKNLDLSVQEDAFV
ncbi:MAG: T4 RnlA family RNA ligase [Acidobacteriota bacterium]